MAKAKASAKASKTAKKTKIRPLGEKVLIKRLEAEEKTAGGIVLPDAAKEKPQQGKVVFTGPGKLLDEGKRAGMLVKKGDVVLYGRYAGTDVRVGDSEYKIMRESDILAKLDKPAKG